MMKQECVLLFPEVETVARKMTDEQFGILIRAVIAYRLRGEVYSGDDIAVDIAFYFLANQQDRVVASNAAKSKAAKEKWAKKAGEEGMQNDAEPMQADAELMQKDAPIQSKESVAAAPPAPARRDRKGYGKFGWVKLTQEEYARLRTEMGQEELDRCITYLDQSAQATGNKNKWKDWFLVLRKCHDENWGRRAYGRYASQSIPKGASGHLGEAELEAIQQVLRDGGS